MAKSAAVIEPRHERLRPQVPLRKVAPNLLPKLGVPRVLCPVRYTLTSL